MKYSCLSAVFIFVSASSQGVSSFLTTSQPLQQPNIARRTVLQRFPHNGAIFADASGEEEPINRESLAIDNRASHLLTDAIGFNSSAATLFVTEIDQMRNSGAPRETIDQVLNDLLTAGPDSRLPFWTHSKRMARFSRRARMASLRRTLDRTTPPQSDNGSNTDDREQQAQRRRRTLMALLRSLSTEPVDDQASNIPAIVQLEKKAIQAEKDNAGNLRSRLPEGFETPDYDIITAGLRGRKNVEIRRYKPYSVCAVPMNKPRPIDSSKTDAKIQMPEISGASSFGALAGYLFGKNEKSMSMKMTMPVFTSPVDEERQMEFVLPSEYWKSVSSAPQPLAQSGVILQEKESEDRAVLMFGGYASKTEVEKRKKELMTALSKHPEWQAAEAEAMVAQYNDPFTVPWKRLNEVSLKVVKQ